MKRLFLAAILLAVSAISAYAQNPSAVSSCGGNPYNSDLRGPFQSDPSGSGPSQQNMGVYRSDLRAITVRSSKGRTRVHSLYAYDNNSGRWITLMGFTILNEDQEWTTCIPRSWNVSQVSVSTSGGDNAKFRVYFSYK